MKLILIALLTIIFLSACVSTPQVTVTPETTATLLPASPTPELTSTPEPTSTPIVEATSEAMQETNQLIEAYGLADEVAEGKITVTEVDGVVSVTMKVGEPGEEVEKVIMRSSEFGIQHDPAFAVDTIAKNSCEPTDIKPNPNNGLVSQAIS
ncbi:MAG: hypothetical protein RIR73_2798, partial [Chloroflexota bacterium]